MEKNKQKKSQANQTRRADLETRRGGQRGGRSEEKEGGMHGAGLGIAGKSAGTGDRGGAKELGEGRRGCRAGVVPTWEAHG